MEPSSIENLNKEAFDSLQLHGYLIKESIGKGGFGSVFRVLHQNRGQVFVCKVLSQFISFSNEIQTLVMLDHPNVIKLYEQFVENDKFYLILEDCSQGDIASYLKTHHCTQEEIANFCYQTITALEYLHTHGICHRDIKPSNILIDKNGHLKLADFGLSDNCYGYSKSYSGTKFYMAPEIFDKRPYNPFKADVWSLGITIYYMMFQKLPFDNSMEWVKFKQFGLMDTPLPDIICESLDRTLRMCMNPHPHNRATISEVREVILKCPLLNQSKIAPSRSLLINTRIKQVVHIMNPKSQLLANINASKLKFKNNTLTHLHFRN